MKSDPKAPPSSHRQTIRRWQGSTIALIVLLSLGVLPQCHDPRTPNRVDNAVDQACDVLPLLNIPDEAQEVCVAVDHLLPLIWKLLGQQPAGVKGVKIRLPEGRTAGMLKRTGAGSPSASSPPAPAPAPAASSSARLARHAIAARAQRVDLGAIKRALPRAAETAAVDALEHGRLVAPATADAGPQLRLPRRMAVTTTSDALALGEKPQRQLAHAVDGARAMHVAQVRLLRAATVSEGAATTFGSIHEAALLAAPPPGARA